MTETWPEQLERVQAMTEGLTNYVGRANTDALRAVLARLAELEAENEKLRTAVKFYTGSGEAWEGKP